MADRLVTQLVDVELERPVLVVGLEQWIDAGFGAAAAVAALLGGLRTEPFATIDTDNLLDHRVRRPMTRIVDGINTGLAWPEIQLRYGADPNGKHALLLMGPEPALSWRAFADAIVDLARQVGVRLVVGLGAFPAPVPHTRPVRLAATATNDELAAEVGYVPGVIEVPAGISAVLERAFAEVDIPAVGIWARVPHYLANMPYPAASAALIEGLATISGLELDTSELQAAAHVTRARVDELIAANEEHHALVSQLEEQVDTETDPSPIALGDLPTGDEIAAELERFLRNQGD